MNQRIKTHLKAKDTAFYYMYLLATEPEKKVSEKRQKKLFKYAESRIRFFDRKAISKCIKKYHYDKMDLETFLNLFFERKMYERLGISRELVCCVSCHCGISSTLAKDIENQKNKYGVYICKNCEKTSLDIGKTQDIVNSLYTKLYIDRTGLYYDGGVRPKNERMLGFGGRWFLCKCKDKNWLTNNLFISTSLHEKLLPNYEHNINFEHYQICSEDDLNQYLSPKEIEEIKETCGYERFIS